MGSSNAKFSPALFVSGTKDDLAVVDVYKLQSSAVYNSFQDIAKNISGLLNSIPGMNLGEMLGKANNVLQGIKGGIDKAAGMINNGVSGISSMMGAISGLQNINGIGSARNALGSVLNSLGSLANVAGLQGLTNALQNAYACMGGISQIVDSVNGVVNAGRGLQSTIETGFGNLLGGSSNRYASIAGIDRYGGYTTTYGGYNDSSRGYGGAIGSSSDYIDISAYPYTTTGVSSNNTSTTSNIKPAVSNTATISNVDVTEIARNISAGNMEIFSNINSLPESVIPMMNVGMTESQISSNVVAQVGNSLSRLSPEISAEAAKPLVDIVNNITDGKFDATITNRGSAAALISGATYIANEIGMPGVFRNIAENVKDANILVEAAKPLVQKAVDTGDMRLLASVCIDPVVSEIRSLAPDICGTILTNIERPETLAEQEYGRYYQGIKESFDAINSNWTKYNRCGTDIVNAAQLSGNFFILDLIRAQLNEIQHPNNYIGNIQSVHGDGYKFDTTINERIDKIIAHPDEDGNVQSLNLDKVVVESFEFSTAGNAIDPIGYNSDDPNAPYIAVGLDDDNIKYISLSDEYFMLLSGMYLNDSVNECLARDFPEWYATLEDKPIKPCSYIQ